MSSSPRRFFLFQDDLFLGAPSEKYSVASSILGMRALFSDLATSLL